MSDVKTKNKRTAMAMVASMLLASLMIGVLSSINASILPLASQALPIGLPEKIGDFALAPFSMILSSGLTGLVLAVLPATLSRKKTLLAGLLLITLATLFAVFARTPFELVCWSFLCGIGWTMHFCAWISIGANYFPRHCAMVVACMNFVTTAGGIAAPQLTAIILAPHDQREALLLPGLIGLLVLAFLFILIMHLFQRLSVADKRRLIRPDVMGLAPTLWSRGPLLLCLAVIGLPLVSYGMYVSYSTYLREVMGLSLKTANLMIGMFVLASFLSPLGAWLGDRHGTFKVLLIVLPITGALGGLMFMGWDIPLPVIMLTAFLTGVGVHSVFYVNVQAALITSLAPAQSMRAVGLFCAAYSLFLPIAGVLFMRMQSATSWKEIALLQIVGPLFLATLLVWLAQHTLRSRGKAVALD